MEPGDWQRKWSGLGEHLARCPAMPAKLVIVDDRAVRGGRRLAVQLEIGSDVVPGVLLLPLEPRPAPAALLLHGYSSDKERMSDSAGRALLGHGVATLAIDLPLHGERVTAGSAAGIPSEESRNPIRLAQRWRAALAECDVALHLLEKLPEVDPARLSLIGYSMGAYLGVMLAAGNPSVRALVLAAGGDLPDDLPFASLVRRMVDPLQAIRQFSGRPLLMVNGRNDRTIRPAQAERLFAAAGEPKRIVWYDGGHWLPDSAVREAAAWLTQSLAKR